MTAPPPASDPNLTPYEFAKFIQKMNADLCSSAANLTFITGVVQEIHNKLEGMEKKLNQLTDRQKDLAWAIHRIQGSTAPGDDGAER